MNTACTFVCMKGYQIILLGVLSWGIHEVSFHLVEGVPLQFPYYYDDYMTILRPTVNLIYNGSFRQPLSPSEMRNIPKPLQAILGKAEDDGECLPHEGIYPAVGIFFFGPSILLASWTNLTPEDFEILLIFWSKLISLLSNLTIFYLISLLYTGYPRSALAIASILVLILPPQISFYANTAEYYFLFILLSITYSIIYIRKRYRWTILLTQLAILFAYFSKFRTAPLIFMMPIIAFVIEHGYKKYLIILSTLLIWLIPQAVWSFHVHKITCKWALTSPSDIFSVSLCGGKKVEACFSPHQTYNYVRVNLGRLEAALGYPHSIQYHPRSLMGCIMKTIKENDIEARCLPPWIYDEYITKERWLVLLRKIRYFSSPELSPQEQIEIGNEVASELDSIVIHIKRKYWWLPFYRAYRVIVDNAFHPIPHKETGRGRFPIWLKIIYFGYHSAYVGIALVIGLFSGIYWMIRWLRKQLTPEEKGIGLLFMFSGWGLIAVPMITGHSEWRYFYASAILFMVSAPYFLGKAYNDCVNWFREKRSSRSHTAKRDYGQAF